MGHYFQETLLPLEKLDIESVINGHPSSGLPKLNLTPAQVEQMTAENDTIPEMVKALENKVQSRLLGKPVGGTKQQRLNRETSVNKFGTIDKPQRKSRDISVSFDV